MSTPNISTPPWIYDPVEMCVYSQKAARVAELLCEEGCMSDEIIEANGYLLAAAPELLEACRSLLAEVIRLTPDERKPVLAASPKAGIEYVGVNPHEKPCVIAAQAASAKSEGK